jgi:hypothetical protein
MSSNSMKNFNGYGEFRHVAASYIVSAQLKILQTLISIGQGFSVGRPVKVSLSFCKVTSPVR